MFCYFHKYHYAMLFNFISKDDSVLFLKYYNYDVVYIYIYIPRTVLHYTTIKLNIYSFINKEYQLCGCIGHTYKYIYI